MNGIHKIDWMLIASKKLGKNFEKGSCELDLSTDDVKNEVDGIDIKLARKFLKQMLAECRLKDSFKHFETTFIFKNAQYGNCLVSELRYEFSLRHENFERALLENIEDGILHFRKFMKFQTKNVKS